MIDIARVISVSNNVARVVVRSEGSCGGGSCAGCSGGCGASGGIIEAENTAGACVGQDVKIEMKTTEYLKAAILVYGLPLIMFLVGIISGNSVHDRLSVGMPGELFSVIMGTVFWIVSYFIIRAIDKKFKMSNKARYTIIEVI